MSSIPPATEDTVAEGINDAGQIVGQFRDVSNIFHGFLLSGGTFTTLNDPLATQGTDARGINDAGQIVGFYGDANSFHGRSWASAISRAAAKAT